LPFDLVYFRRCLSHIVSLNDTLHYITFSFYPKRLTIKSHSYTVETATESNSGLSVLLKDTSTRAGIEPPTPIERRTCYPLTRTGGVDGVAAPRTSRADFLSPSPPFLRTTSRSSSTSSSGPSSSRRSIVLRGSPPPTACPSSASPAGRPPPGHARPPPPPPSPSAPPTGVQTPIRAKLNPPGGTGYDGGKGQTMDSECDTHLPESRMYQKDGVRGHECSFQDIMCGEKKP